MFQKTGRPRQLNRGKRRRAIKQSLELFCVHTKIRHADY